MYKETNPKDRIAHDRPSMSSVPPAVLAEIGIGMHEGAVKYGLYNWRDAGARYSVYYNAALRHLYANYEGEDIDPDSGLSHITKAICSLVVLRDAMINDTVYDDRPTPCDNFQDHFTSLKEIMRAINLKYLGD